MKREKIREIRLTVTVAFVVLTAIGVARIRLRGLDFYNVRIVVTRTIGGVWKFLARVRMRSLTAGVGHGGRREEARGWENVLAATVALFDGLDQTR